MPGLERLLDRRPLVVDAPVQRAGPEKGALGARLIQNVDQRGRVLVRPVVVRQCQHPRRRALGDDDARVRRALDQLERAGRGDGEAGGGGEEDGHEAGGGEHFGGFVRVVEKRVLEDQAGNGEAPGVISWRHLHRGSGARTSFFGIHLEKVVGGPPRTKGWYVQTARYQRGRGELEYGQSGQASDSVRQAYVRGAALACRCRLPAPFLPVVGRPGDKSVK